MGGMFGIGGSASKTDRSNQLTGYGDLQNIFNYGLDSGKQGQAQGQQQLGQAGDYWSKLLTGNRSDIMSAMQPEISSVTGQGDAARRQQSALGTSRGGGTNALNQQAQTKEQAQISNMVAGARPQAAQQVANIGTAELSNSGNLLGLGNNAAGNLTSNATNSYKVTSAQNQAQGQAAGQIASALLFGM